MADREQDRVGIVLGASSGIGAAVTTRMASRVGHLIAASRRGTVDSGERGSGRATGYRCDIRSYRQVAQLFSGAPAPIDFVVHCVGVGFYAPLDADYSTAWAAMTATNLVGLANMLAVAHQQVPQIGAIVVVSSMAAHRGSLTPGNAMYTATKAGARALVADYRRRLRTEGRTTRIMSISPGLVTGTDFAENFFDHASVAPTDIYADRATLTADDVATLVESMLNAPAQVEIADLLVRPRDQSD